MIPQFIIGFNSAEELERWQAANEQSKDLVLVYTLQSSFLQLIANILSDPKSVEQLTSADPKYAAADAWLRREIEGLMTSDDRFKKFPKARQVADILAGS